MSPGDVVRRHYELFNAADYEAWASLLTQDFTVHHASMGDTSGRDAYLAGIRFYRASFPDVTVTLGRMLEGDDLVAAEFTSTATFAADWLGTPATGERWELPGMGFFRIDADQLAETWFYEDATKWAQRLAAPPRSS